MMQTGGKHGSSLGSIIRCRMTISPHNCLITAGAEPQFPKIRTPRHSVHIIEVVYVYNPIQSHIQWSLTYTKENLPPRAQGVKEVLLKLGFITKSDNKMSKLTLAPWAARVTSLSVKLHVLSISYPLYRPSSPHHEGDSTYPLYRPSSPHHEGDSTGSSADDGPADKITVPGRGSRCNGTGGT